MPGLIKNLITNVLCQLSPQPSNFRNSPPPRLPASPPAPHWIRCLEDMPVARTKQYTHGYSMQKAVHPWGSCSPSLPGSSSSPTPILGTPWSSSWPAVSTQTSLLAAVAPAQGPPSSLPAHPWGLWISPPTQRSLEQPHLHPEHPAAPREKATAALFVLEYVFFTEKIIHKLTNTKMYKHMGK